MHCWWTGSHLIIVQPYYCSSSFISPIIIIIIIIFQIIAYAKEIDGKYAISATVGRIVNAGANAIILAFNKAKAIDEQHKISERAAEAAAKVAAKAKEIDEKYEVTKKIEDTTSKAIAAVQTQFQKMTSKGSEPQAPGDGNGVTIEELPVATPVVSP